jgi:uncharacterized protein YbbC (DUF1343 family)
VRTGAELLIAEHLYELEGRKIGLVMNPTARIANVHLLDTLLQLKVDIKALFSPEHGFRGQFSDGEIIQDGIDKQSGLPVYSLYGATKKPTQDMLKGIDLLLFDMQDVGARFYTFNSTMRYVIEAASEYNIEIWILDRPNPASGEYVSGWVLDAEFESMVGSHFTPVAHGMTLAELALMGIGEGWYQLDGNPQIRVIKMEGWTRSMKWPDTGLPWIPPSPNLPTFEHAFVYLGTCFIEGTNISEGRGTPNPFLTVGAPDYISDTADLNILKEKYKVEIDTLSFKPKSIPRKSLHPKYKDVLLGGIYIHPKSDFLMPVEFGVDVTNHFLKNAPKSTFREYINLLTGKKFNDSDSLKINWQNEVNDFKIKRKKYLLYQ